MRAFNVKEYFQNLGNNWRLNTITGSIFYGNEEVIINRGSVRGVLTELLREKKRFKIFSFLKRNFVPIEDLQEKEHNVGAWIKAMQLVIDKILNKYGFSIQVENGTSNKKTEWSLCRVNQ